MATYRVYCLDGSSRFVTAEEVEAASDDDALKAAARFDGGLRREVWRGDRHIGTLEIEAPKT